MRRMYDENQIKDIAGGTAYRHIITVTGTDVPWSDIVAYLTVVSSNNLNVDSLTDLKTLLGNTFTYPATGKDPYNSSDTGFIYCITESNVISSTGSSSLAKLTKITDTVTAI